MQLNLIKKGRQASKADNNTKIEKTEEEIPNHHKCNSTTELNKLKKESFPEILKPANLWSKNDFVCKSKG